MIVENQKIDVKITRRNISIYKKLGYKDIKIGDVITIGVDDLTKGSQVKVAVKCDYCGNIVMVKYRDYMHYKFDKYSCKHCKQKKTSEYNLKQRQEDLYQRALNFCNEKGYKLLTLKEDILNSDTRVLYSCPKHGVHETKIYTLITKHKCIDCSVEEVHAQKRKDVDEVYNDFKKYGGVLLNKNDYIGWNHKNLKVICHECGNVFTTSYCAFMQHEGQVCLSCSSIISKGERCIKEWLENNNINFYMQFKFNDCRNINPLPFDFYLPEYNICIEYDGEGHYMPIKRGSMSNLDAQELLDNIHYRDNIKTIYCSQRAIKLIRIPYWDFSNIQDILTKELFT
jgi:hypothetical protein